MKILQCVGSMNTNQGGPPRVVEGLSLAMADLGVEIIILGGESSYTAENFAREWPKLDAHKDITFLADPNLVKQAGFFETISVVHFHGVWDYFFLGVSKQCIRQNLPYFVSSHGCLDPWSMSQKSIKKKVGLHILGFKRFLNQAAGIIYASDDERQLAVPLGCGAPARVVSNGVAIPDTQIPPPSFPPEAQIATQCETKLIYFARFHKKKGVELLAKAFSLVSEEFPNAGLFLIGIEQDLALERRLRADLSGNPRAFVTSKIFGPDAQRALAHSDCLVLPSYQEGFSIAVLEAMSLGLPILVSKPCRLSDAVDQGAGWECEPTVEALTESLRQVLSLSPSELKATGMRALQIVKDNYTWPKMAETSFKYYTDAVSKNG